MMAQVMRQPLPRFSMSTRGSIWIMYFCVVPKNTYSPWSPNLERGGEGGRGKRGPTYTPDQCRRREI